MTSGQVYILIATVVPINTPVNIFLSRFHARRAARSKVVSRMVSCPSSKSTITGYQLSIKIKKTAVSFQFVFPFITIGSITAIINRQIISRQNHAIYALSTLKIKSGTLMMAVNGVQGAG